MRLDQLLVARGLAESRARAQALLLAGVVQVDGTTHTKPGTAVDERSEVTVAAALPYVSRGGYKLAHALEAFRLSPAGLTALDAGASTGGFTDVLLQQGAARVYAVDVGYGILDWRLRQDERVIVLERTNIRHLQALPPPDETTTAPAPILAQCVVIDVSFISLRLVLPAVLPLMTADAWLVALIKPQFEAGPGKVNRRGVVRDAAIHREVLHEVLLLAAGLGLPACGLARSPITGPAGNVEFLAWLQRDGLALDVAQAIDQVTD